jgi:hypothetical protein
MLNEMSLSTLTRTYCLQYLHKFSQIRAVILHMFACLTIISQLSICYDTLDAKDLFLSDLTISFIDWSGLHTVHVHAVVTLKIGSRFQ